LTPGGPLATLTARLSAGQWEGDVSKEKFELMFLGGGAMLDVLSRRLRRPAMTPRESIGAAMYGVERVLAEERERLAEPDAAAGSLRAMREELCAAAPRRAVLDATLDEFADRVRPVDELAAPIDRLRTEVARWLG
jgi:hypothetical protein